MSNDQSTVLAVLNHGALTYFDLQRGFIEMNHLSSLASDFGYGLLVVILWVIS